MELSEKLEILAEIMDVEEEELAADMSLEDIEEWDSLSALALTVTMKKEFGIDLTTEIIQRFKTVSDICDMMQ